MPNMKFAAVLSSFLLAAVPAVVADDECKTIQEIVCETDNLMNFCGLIDATDTGDVFGDKKDLTVFAPVDTAVTTMDLPAALDDEKLREVVLFHVHKGALLAEDMECAAGYNMLEMESGKDSRTICVDFIPVFQKGGGNSEGYEPAILSTNIEACNGVVHTVDKVLLPNGFQEYEITTGSPNSANGGSASSGASLVRLSLSVFAGIFMFLLM